MGDGDREEETGENQYYLADEIKGMFNIINQNMRSFNRNSGTLIQYLDRIPNTKIITMQEMWETTGNEKIPGFQTLYTKTRSSKRGGGVSIGVFEGLQYKEIDAIFVESEFESIGIELEINKKMYSIFNVYCPPKTDLDIILTHLTNIISNNTNKLIICGDFNVDISSSKNSAFLDEMLNMKLFPLYTNDTRITKHSSTCLDLIFTNDNTITGGVCQADISDHLLTFASLKHNKSKPVVRTIPDHSTKAIEKLKKSLKETKFDEVLNEKTTAAFEIFEKIMYKARDECCPMKTINCKVRLSPPWFSKGFKVSCRKKDKLMRKARRTRKPAIWERYVKYRNLYYKLCKIAKYQFYRSEFHNNAKDSKKIWALTNNLLGREKSKPSIHTFPNCKTDTEIATVFSDYFSNVASNLAKTIPKSKKPFTAYLPKETTTKFNFRPMFPSEIAKIIDKMRPKTSFGRDMFSNKILKAIKDEIKLPLCHLINLSIKYSYIPASWKVSKILPLHKGGHKTECSNFRPISLLSTFSKVLERCIADQVIDHMEKNGLFYSHQYGFRRQRTCSHLLQKYQDIVFESRQTKKHCLSVAIDCSKAFDTINHDILLTKIQAYGINTQWFAHYLSGRHNYVSIGNQNSAETEQKIGVPQGSVLASLLFSIYINDLPLCNEAQCLLFADDSTFLCTSDNIKSLYKKTNLELSKIEDWLNSNQLSVNAKKSKYLLHSHHRKKGLPDLWLGGQKIDRVGEKCKDKSHKILGIWIDENLSYHHHLSSIYKKVQIVLAIIMRSKVILPMRIKMLIYNALIMSRLSYCCTIFGGTTGISIEKINIIQRKALRIISMARFNAHCDPIYFKLGTLKFEHLIELNFLKSGHNLLNNKEPYPISKMFHFTTDTKTRSSGQRKLYVPKCRIESIKHLTKHKIPVVWNSAVDNSQIKLGGKITSLIKSYKQWRLDQYSKFLCTAKNCFSCNNG